VSRAKQFQTKLYYLQCKQFQFVDSLLFGQVKLAVFRVLLKYFSDKDGLAPSKIGPYTYAWHNHNTVQ